MIKDYGRTPDDIESLDVEKLDTKQVQELYRVEGFFAPYVTVTRKSDNVRGIMEFSHNPRYYFNFTPS